MDILSKRGQYIPQKALQPLKRVAVTFFLIFIHSLYGSENTKIPFPQYSIEWGGSVSAGVDSSQWVSTDALGDTKYTLVTETKWYMDIQPVVSFYFLADSFVYGSPAFSLNKKFFKYEQLDLYGVFTPSPQKTEADTEIDFIPFLGVGYIFHTQSDYIFLSVGIDMQRTEYMLWTRNTLLNPKDVFTYPSLTRFNLRVTPKVRIGERAFLNVGMTFYYETDQIMVAWFGQKGFDVPLEDFGFGLQLGLSWVY